jgi:hypothetical protein
LFDVRITKTQITVEFQKRAHNPLRIAAGLNNIETRIPDLWLSGSFLKCCNVLGVRDRQIPALIHLEHLLSSSGLGIVSLLPEICSNV